ncbi:MAG: UDP-N-acetylmuramate--L-alanine ligase [Propionicimonas sp.]
MPLIRPVPLLPATEVGDVHFIAIGGAGMSGIATAYAELGVRVSGSDQADSAALRELQARGIDARVGHDPANLGTAATVVISSAVRETNVELAEARRRGLRIWHRSAGLAALMVHRTGIAVTGTHGKTTTSAMTAVLLAETGADPSYVIGSPLTSSGTSAHLGGGEAFVVEADESDGSFLQYPARIVVITNIEADHLDNWGTAEAYAAGFAELTRAAGVEAVVLSADDPGTRVLIDPLRAAGKQVVTVGESWDADVRLEGLSFSGARASAHLHADGDQGPLSLVVPGRYNLLNAAAAYAVGRLLGIDGARLRQAATAFDGTDRRFQRVGEVNGVTVIDDYAHHPTEVVATLTAARVLAGAGRLVACFQPHLFTRTRDFAGQFARALSLADVIVVLGIYAAREDPIPGVTGHLVIDALEGISQLETIHYVEEMSEAPGLLAGLVTPGDLVVTLGAGDVTRVGPALVGLLAAEDHR